MYTSHINVKRLILPLLVVLLLEGCYGLLVPRLKSVTYQTIYEAQIDPNQYSVRLITKEESLLLFAQVGVGIDIVELTNNQFKMHAYFEGSYLEMRLNVPTGEELFIKESFGGIFDATAQQELYKFDAVFDADWEISFELKSNIDAVPGKFIGLVSSPPETIYRAWKYLSFTYDAAGEEVVLKLPVFGTNEGETIKFDDVTFKASTSIEKEYGVDWIPLIRI